MYRYFANSDSTSQKMKILLILLAITLAVQGNGNATFERIIDGRDAKIRDFPYSVYLNKLYYPNKFYACGGSILNERFILTAAHCICVEDENDLPQYTIQYGKTQVDLDSVETIEVMAIHCHPKYDQLTAHNDIAIMELASPIPKGNWAPVKLAKDFNAKTSKRGVIIGWGQLEYEGEQSDVLQKTHVDIYDDAANCHYTTICIGSTKGRTCLGDSGSPLLVDGHQVGLASWVPLECFTADKENSVRYANVALSYNWIAEVAGLDKGSDCNCCDCCNCSNLNALASNL